MQAREIVNLFKQLPTYTPPVSWERVGELAFEQGEAPESHWPSDMRRGWIRTLRAAAYADANAYLVGQGVAQ